LEKIFQHSRSQAEAISWKVHQEGKGVAGVYFKEIAENKVAKTLQLATLYEYPLRCVFEPESQEE
jgi:ATP-dependent Clp protease adaptor protein ClpS